MPLLASDPVLHGGPDITMTCALIYAIALVNDKFNVIMNNFVRSGEMSPCMHVSVTYIATY